MRSLSITFLAMSLVWTAPAAAKAPARTVAQQVEAYIAPFAKAGHFSGTFLVAQNGKVVFENSYGFANAELGVRNTPRSRIGSASITKFMTIIVFERLATDGKVARTDTVAKYFPSFPRGNEITLDMLLRHRSGLTHRVTTPLEEAMALGDEEMLKRLASAKLEAEPGSTYVYSSAGFWLLATILERATGKRFAELLKEHVFAPARMTDSVDFDAKTIIPNRAVDYVITTAGIVNAPYKDFAFLKGAGSAYSTASDLYRLGLAILGGKFGQRVHETLVSNGTLTGSGATAGRRSFLKLKEDGTWAYTLSSNLNNGANDLIMQNVEAILEGRPVKPVTIPKITVGKPPADLSRFVGRYVPAPGQPHLSWLKVNASIIDGGLYLSDQEIFPLGGDCFFNFRGYGEVCFKRDANGAPSEMHWIGGALPAVLIKE